MGDPSTTPYLVARNVARGTVLAAHLETATGLWARGMGLMGRAPLAADGGLWIPGTNGIHMMFMRFPIDAVFVGRAIDAEGGARPVLSVHRRLRTWIGIVPLVRGADGVIELPVGTIERSGTVVGDRILMEPAVGSQG